MTARLAQQSGNFVRLLAASRFFQAILVIGTIVLLPAVSLAAAPVAGGDCNGDGAVNGVDFLCWQRGDSENPLSAEDLETWRVNYGSSAPVLASKTIPEPSSLSLVGAGLGLLLFRLNLRRARQPLD